MSHNLSLGDRGEEIAAQYLGKKGYRIREKKWRSKVGEVDIIAEKGGVVVFVEVKTRTGTTFGQPEEAVTTTKQQHIIRTAELYCQMHRLTTPYRIDVVAVTLLPNGKEDILHFEDITGS